MEFAKQHPEKMFVQKNNNHRGIKIEKLENLSKLNEKLNLMFPILS